MADPHGADLQRHLEAHLRPELSPAFLETLVQAARTCGLGVEDYGAVQDFVRWCFRVAGETEPADLTPLNRI
jgi:hypothetical protein